MSEALQLDTSPHVEIERGNIIIDHGEGLIGPNVKSIDGLEWQSPPAQDSLGADVFQTKSVRVGTREELAAALQFAREQKLLVRPAGALTSSKAFVSPPASFMKRFDKTGVMLLGFNPSGDFSKITVDEDRRLVRAGASVTLAEVAEAVRLATWDNDLKRPRLESLMTITTMDAMLVATALGSGGVADSSHSSTTLMRSAQWMDGRGRLHDEANRPSASYFDYSSFNEVHSGRIAKEMTGRGAPFGIGTEVVYKLGEAPVRRHQLIIPFRGSNEEVREKLQEFIVAANLADERVKGSRGVLYELKSLELMGIDAMEMAKDGMNGWTPEFEGEEPKAIIIVDVAEYQNGHELPDEFDSIGKIVELGLIPEEFFDEAVYIDSSKHKKLDAFRLQGPEHIRSVRKRKYSNAPTCSTDWAVYPGDERLVEWYFDRFFDLHDQIVPHADVRALYGHCLRRLDLHHRVVVSDRDAMAAHLARKIEFGHELVNRQVEGEWVRVRGEKVELPFGEHLACIGMRRGNQHGSTNVALLRELDPSGLFSSIAPERWGGRYDWR
ncbi:FAD-binding oxidoreductase [Candidatus Peregrinibacteria bacterium]|jgi:FAD/FMN-containing dehydrogenase|nr:FAD-binding oxidoreductase [Candidatus Peregrinibacteria bacterium]MBT4632148.1 FAD-binding oxidoreductase [Candidatus Peregrinibacteria bacterium]MBT5517071.1 FAD-binding oxidoreductase [Candidatus Peregrinibacteria bacterium]MBT5824066.1 FAD-binding oxidoreductase [Candidatus Peregrinibacteria bacterium]